MKDFLEKDGRIFLMRIFVIAIHTAGVVIRRS